ncbi:MaoC family dehydratase N-terminal domain-containing protein [Actinokineospora spheciospongiae]|uniref:MaoC family dehydratase N-terminal domain-containing protein n=1 Tax=Actinokineospora spheciospongiae TaxID=909613 RepID=UPI000558DB94|nr:MaoC family dehydratase N-terminal domain-containing protein [Actinokineospora spheciospongiae]PWW64268.1 acyl dehydratase [Actinokineospora spheciospongiae]
MALDQSFVGRTYPPSPVYEVGRAKIKEFVDAIGDTDPVHRDPEAARAAGFPDVVAPPTFTTILNLELINTIVSDPKLGLDYGRMVHGDQSFEYHRPVVAGDRLVAVGSVQSIMSRAGNDFIVLRAEITTESGEPRVTGTAQLVVRDAGVDS